MKLSLFILAASLCVGQATLTISQQPSPFPLTKGMALYSGTVCSSGARTISAAQIRQAVEGVGISFQDPALNASALAAATSKTPTSRVLTLTKWLSTGFSVAGGVVTYVKSQSMQVGNAKTWAEISVATGAFGAGAGILQPFIQADVNAQAVAITSGVQAALVSDMAALYSIPAGGCMRSVMFFGGVSSGVKMAVIP